MTMSVEDQRTPTLRFAPVPDPPSPDVPGHRRPGRIGQWPRRSYLELAAQDAAPGCARRHACALLKEWDLDDITDECALIMSELVTNSVISTQADGLTSPVRLWVLGDASSALLLIWDAIMAAPALTNAGPGDEGGRGLALVEALSHRWGWYHPHQATAGTPGGKVTWALLQAAGAPGGNER